MGDTKSLGYSSYNACRRVMGLYEVYIGLLQGYPPDNY